MPHWQPVFIPVLSLSKSPINHTALYSVKRINLRGRCLRLQPGLPLMDVGCHFATVTDDVRAWHCVWVIASIRASWPSRQGTRMMETASHTTVTCTWHCCTVNQTNTWPQPISKNNVKIPTNCFLLTLQWIIFGMLGRQNKQLDKVYRA